MNHEATRWLCHRKEGDDVGFVMRLQLPGTPQPEQGLGHMRAKLQARSDAISNRAAAFVKSWLLQRNEASARRSTPFSSLDNDGIVTPPSQKPYRGHDSGNVPVFGSNPGPVQTKLAIGRPGDRFEKEADRMANQVMHLPVPPAQHPTGPEDSERGKNPVEAPNHSRHARNPRSNTAQRGPITSGHGKLLDTSTRSFMEPVFGHDFSQVRIFSDSKAAAVTQALGARAFTVGQQIFFRSSEYQPMNSSGRELLAHELTHVVQQSGGIQPIKQTSQYENDHRQLADQDTDTLMESDRGGAEGNAMDNGVQHSGQASTKSETQRNDVAISRVEGPPLIQRRLIATGDAADIADFIGLVEPAIGLQLEHDTTTSEIRAIGSLATPATTPALAAILTRIMDDPAQNAEVNIGRGQARVAVGAFPQPADLTAGAVQLIDIDDILAIEAGAPGSGLAKVAHEIQENYHAHSFPVVAGTSRFPESHREGIAAESAVARETVGPGNRVASVTTQIGSNVFTRVQDFETYFLVFDLTRVGTDFSVSNARHAPRVNVGRYTIDGFVTGSDVMPAAGAATIARAVADLTANATATVRVEGFTDDVGTPAVNNPLSLRRAESARNRIIAAGATGGPGRIHVVGRGQTAFAAPNDSEANRARNRRVVIRIDRPGP